MSMFHVPCSMCHVPREDLCVCRRRGVHMLGGGHAATACGALRAMARAGHSGQVGEWVSGSGSGLRLGVSGGRGGGLGVRGGGLGGRRLVAPELVEALAALSVPHAHQRASFRRRGEARAVEVGGEVAERGLVRGHDGRARDVEELHLNAQRRWHRRLWRQLARAPEAVAGRPVGRPAPPWECRAAQSRQARPEEAQGPSWALLRRAP
jgi:hypothetical protein